MAVERSADGHEPVVDLPGALRARILGFRPGRRASIQESAPATSGLIGRRVMITGVNYWPELSGISPYTAGLAEHLAEQGAEVVVLTAMPSYPAWRVFEDYRGSWRRRGLERGVEVQRFRIYVPGRQSAVRRAGYEFSFLAHGITHRRLERRPDVVLGVVPSLSGGVLARVEARRYGCPYGLIVQDLVGPAAAESGISGGSSVAAATTRLESWVARGATQVGVISARFRTYLERVGVDPDRIVHLRNWVHVGPTTESRQETRSLMGWPEDTKIVLHTGNMGLKQGLEHVVAAARVASTELPDTRFVMLGDGSQRQSLEALAGQATNVEFRNLVDEASYPNVLAAADVLLVNERATIVDMSLPGKLTSYFAAARPVVAAVPANGATAREVTQADAGIVVPAEDPNALVGALRLLDRQPELGPRLGAAGAAYAEAELSPAACLARASNFVRGIIDEAAACNRQSSAGMQPNEA